MKIKFDRVVTYHEHCEATIPNGSNPERQIADADYETFLVIGRSVVDLKLGDIEEAA